MSFLKNLKILAASSSLLALVSCGGDHSSKSHSAPQREAVCSTADCAAAMKWKILLQGRSFPHKATVQINGTDLLNECLGKQKYFIDRSTDPQSISMESYATPVQGELKISVINCTDSSVIFTQDNVPFDIVKDARGASEVLVNL
jgi:1-aminocyclopropane-1-carboxylate deaminase/D-cysteine desulfhydrase-like pyridoxal-dependent ACC family enzyme